MGDHQEHTKENILVQALVVKTGQPVRSPLVITAFDVGIYIIRE